MTQEYPTTNTQEAPAKMRQVMERPERFRGFRPLDTFTNLIASLPARTLGIALVTLALGLSAATSRAAISLDFANVTNASIQFNGGGSASAGSTFQFNSDSHGNQFQITSVSAGASGDSITDVGSFTGGPFSYGAITTSGGEQYATVTTSGQIVIKDRSGGSVNGNVAFIQVDTFAASGTINANVVVDLTGLTYTAGSTAQTDLEALVANGLGTMVLTFQFTTQETLTQLATATGSNESSFSGTIASAVPEPTTVIAGMLLLLPFGASAFRIVRNRKRAAI